MNWEYSMKRRGAAATKSSQRFRLVGDIIAELKKVTWLKRSEIVRLTGLVLLVAFIVGVILGVIDYGFSRLVNDLLLGR